MVTDNFKNCTYKIYKANLASLCNKHRISLSHHDALMQVFVGVYFKSYKYIMEMYQFVSLLSKVSTINLQYEKTAELTGENFNVFKILGLTTNEVRTHSAFIAELLNPYGSHQKGTLFLNEFLTILKEKIKDSENTNDIEILLDIETSKKPNVEYWIGKGVASDGGYIDILLSDKNNNHVIIENKIYAADQRNQLLRYWQFDNNAPIIYLTLDGKAPSNFSTGNDKNVIEKTICISYKNDIIEWLEKCKRHSVDLPILRETITQYIYLIKKLTAQTTNNQMKNEIVNLISGSGDNLMAAIEIGNSINQAKKNLLFEFAKNLEKRIKLSYHDVIIDISPEFGNRNQGMSIKFANIEDEYILFSFLSNLSGTYIEIANKANKHQPTVSNNGFVVKNIDNVNFYKIEINNQAKEWSDIVKEIDTNWMGDWVCRYSRLDNYLTEPKNWAEIADYKNASIFDDVTSDLNVLISAFCRKHNLL